MLDTDLMPELMRFEPEPTVDVWVARQARTPLPFTASEAELRPCGDPWTAA